MPKRQHTQHTWVQSNNPKSRSLLGKVVKKESQDERSFKVSGQGSSATPWQNRPDYSNDAAINWEGKDTYAAGDAFETQMGQSGEDHSVRSHRMPTSKSTKLLFGRVFTML
jgi:hypothetical protein